MPWEPKDAYRHTHKASSPKAKRQWAHVADSALERGASEGSAIRQANSVVARRKARGGALSALPTRSMPKLAVARPSALGSIANEHMGSSVRMPGMFQAKARMPRVPIADTLRNIDAHVKGAQVKLPKMPVRRGGEIRKAVGGSADGAAIASIKQALMHLKNGDASSAAATLRKSLAVKNSDVAAAEAGLRTSQGVSPATRTLSNIVKTNKNAALSGRGTRASPASMFRRGGSRR